MEQLNWKELEQIPIPEGLEERLSAKIDEWASEEQGARGKKMAQTPTSLSPLAPRPLHLKVTAIAASIALVFGVGFYFLQQKEEPVNLAEQDTYQESSCGAAGSPEGAESLGVQLEQGNGSVGKGESD